MCPDCLGHIFFSLLFFGYSKEIRFFCNLVDTDRICFLYENDFVYQTLKRTSQTLKRTSQTLGYTFQTLKYKKQNKEIIGFIRKIAK